MSNTKCNLYTFMPPDGLEFDYSGVDTTATPRTYAPKEQQEEDGDE